MSDLDALQRRCGLAMLRARELEIDGKASPELMRAAWRAQGDMLPVWEHWVNSGKTEGEEELVRQYQLVIRAFERAAGVS